MLFDDEMISMRYAANLAHGYGLVWNPYGPRVQGFTNPLWVLLMALFHLLPVSPAKMSLLIQPWATTLLLANLVFVWRLALAVSSGSKAAALSAVFLTAFYFQLDYWALEGTEVALLTPMVTLAAYLALRAPSGKPTRWLYLLLAVGTLVRIDMVVPAAAILAILAWSDDAPRRREHLLYGAGLLALFLAAQILLSWWYFGDPLPNTYYLKMTGYPALPRILRRRWP